jgi:hypothetical protein
VQLKKAVSKADIEITTAFLCEEGWKMAEEMGKNPKEAGQHFLSPSGPVQIHSP